MMMLFSLILLISTTILFLKHPISLSIMLLLKAILTAMSTGMMISNFWISYIMTLVMIGGLLIIFLYMTNVASNEKFKFSKLIMIYSMLYLIFMMLIMKFYSINFMLKLNMINNFMLKPNFNIMLMKFFNYPFNSMMILMFIMMLLTMIMSVKMTNLTKGPLRQKY